jgi:hypothetical protein
MAAPGTEAAKAEAKVVTAPLVQRRKMQKLLDSAIEASP